jgi:hypothetical protein
MVYFGKERSNDRKINEGNLSSRGGEYYRY